jgi:RNA polymerase sigma-70 factor (ECF subfamily)
MAEVVAAVHTATPAHQKTEVKDAFARIRETLEPDDQMLLSLRLEQKMSWDEVAAVLEVAAPALRKRFQRLTRRLRELADQLPSAE